MASFMPNYKLVASASLSLFAKAHTLGAVLAFGSALLIGAALHYQKIVKNQYFGYPVEWFPSVSATIGDWFPERNIFHVLIALTAGPRFAVVCFSYILSRRSNSSLAEIVGIFGLARTMACGGWVYITSSDHAEWHDMTMILYIVLNLPWMFGTIALTSSDSKSTRRRRTLVAGVFFGLIPALVYFYVQHKMHRVPGAYSIYGSSSSLMAQRNPADLRDVFEVALFEWSLVAADVTFDSLAVSEFSRLRIQIVDVGLDPPPASSVIFANRAKISAYSPLHSLYLAPPLPRPPDENHGSGLEHAFGVLERLVANLLQVTSTWRHFLADSYLAFLFWSNLTALPPMIFYESVWSMGLSGDEILLFCTLSPALLSIKAVRQAAAAVPNFFHLASLLGIASYKIDDEGGWRLKALAGALGFAILGYTAQWAEAGAREGEIEIHALTFGAGLILSVLVKHSYHSINPVWPFMSDKDGNHADNGGLNGLGLKVGLLAFFDAIVRRRRPQGPPTRKQRSAFLAAATGLGSLLFLLHFLFTDAGTVIAWSWEGYPLRGPIAMPHGVLVLVSLSLGLSLSTFPPTFVYLLSIPASLLLYATKSWSAFAGGLYLAFSTTALLPHLLRAAVQHSPGPTFGLVFLTYAILELASVWTVAFAFVPGGSYLRERTDLVIIATIGGIGWGVANLVRHGVEPSAAETEKFALVESQLRGAYNRLKSLLVIVLLSSLFVVYYRRRLELPTPYHSEERLITASIWTMHFGLDGRMWESQRRMAQVIREAEIDVIGLLESDLQRIVMGNRDMTQLIATELNMYADIGPSPSSHTWGCALLSKFPIINSTHLLLPSPVGELAPAIHATLDVYGSLVDVVVAHNGQEEDVLDRKLQSIELAKRMRVDAAGRPVVFLGYVVTKPGAERPAPYQILVEDGQMMDVDHADDDRWCEYILYRGLHRVAYARLTRGSQPAITDTELQLAKFVVPFPNATSTPDPTSSDDVSEPTQFAPKRHKRQDLRTKVAPFSVDLSGRNHVPSHHMLPGHRFPDMFYGEGVRGHRYHVLRNHKGEFSPWYYLSEEENRAVQNDFLHPAECTTQ